MPSMKHAANPKQQPTFLGRAVQLGQEDRDHIAQAAGQLAGHAVLRHAGLPLPCDAHL